MATNKPGSSPISSKATFERSGSTKSIPGAVMSELTSKIEKRVQEVPQQPQNTTPTKSQPVESESSEESSEILTESTEESDGELSPPSTPELPQRRAQTGTVPVTGQRDSKLFAGKYRTSAASVPNKPSNSKIKVSSNEDTSLSTFSDILKTEEVKPTNATGSTVSTTANAPTSSTVIKPSSKEKKEKEKERKKERSGTGTIKTSKSPTRSTPRKFSSGNLPAATTTSAVNTDDDDDDGVSFFDFLKEDPEELRRKEREKEREKEKEKEKSKPVKSPPKKVVRSESNEKRSFSPSSRRTVHGDESVYDTSTASTTSKVGSPNEDDSEGADDMSIFDFLRMEPTNEFSGSGVKQTQQQQQQQQQKQQKTPAKKETKPILTKTPVKSASKEDLEEEDDDILLFTADELLNKVQQEPASAVASCYYTTHTYVKKTSLENFNFFVDKFHNSDSQTLMTQILDVFDNWIEQTPFVFQEDENYQFMTIFLETVKEKNAIPFFKKRAEQIKMKMDQKREVQSLNQILSDAPAPILPETFEGLVLGDIDAEELARQLTLMDSAIFRIIRPNELMQQNWMKDKKNELSPNVCKFISSFNQTSNWLRMEILTEVTPKQRARVISKLLTVCEHLRRFNNFNGVFQVIAALHASPIFRLKSTFALLSKSKLAIWQKARQIVDEPQAYREALSLARPPLIPYLGMYLTDLIYIDEGNKSPVEGKLNFRRNQLLSRTIKEIQSIQAVRYNFLDVPEIQNFILAQDQVLSDEQVQYNFSMYIEPRANTTPPEMPPELKVILEKKAAAAALHGGNKKRKNVNKFNRQASKTNVVSIMLMKKNSEQFEASLPQLLKQQEEELDAMLNKRIAYVNGCYDTLIAQVTTVQKALNSYVVVLEQTKEQTVQEIRDHHKNTVLTLRNEHGLGQITGWVPKSKHEEELNKLRMRIRELESRGLNASGPGISSNYSSNSSSNNNSNNTSSSSININNNSNNTVTSNSGTGDVESDETNGSSE